jgi:hypothetical protein
MGEISPRPQTNVAMKSLNRTWQTSFYGSGKSVCGCFFIESMHGVIKYKYPKGKKEKHSANAICDCDWKLSRYNIFILFLKRPINEGKILAKN